MSESLRDSSYEHCSAVDEINEDKPDLDYVDLSDSTYHYIPDQHFDGQHCAELERSLDEYMKPSDFQDYNLKDSLQYEKPIQVVRPWSHLQPQRHENNYVPELFKSRSSDLHENSVQHSHVHNEKQHTTQDFEVETKILSSKPQHSKRSKRPCIVGVILILTILIASGIATLMVFYFKGEEDKLTISTTSFFTFTTTTTITSSVSSSVSTSPTMSPTTESVTTSTTVPASTAVPNTVFTTTTNPSTTTVLKTVNPASTAVPTTVITATTPATTTVIQTANPTSTAVPITVFTTTTYPPTTTVLQKTNPTSTAVTTTVFTTTTPTTTTLIQTANPPSTFSSPGMFKDCKELKLNGYNNDGVHSIYPYLPITTPVKVYCDMSTNDGGWTVFQHRRDGSLDFYLLWDDYKKGFGEPNGEYWLGNDHLHQLTSLGTSDFYVRLEKFTGGWAYAKYNNFSVADESDGYRMRLKVGSYQGNAGDSIESHGTTNTNGHKFSTSDIDNDFAPASCAVARKGAWWHNVCTWANLNGLYGNGSCLVNANCNFWYSLTNSFSGVKTSFMMVRRV